MPGVRLVLTGADTADLGSLPCTVEIPDTAIDAPPYPILARDEVRHVGDAEMAVKKQPRGAIDDMKKSSSLKGESPSDLIDARIRELDDWRGSTLSGIRNFIRQADPEVVEELKWRKPTNPAGVPVWSHDGLICTGETYKDHVKVTFAKGASLKDPSRLFNASLEGNARRAIDVHEGEKIDEEAFKALIQAAVALNKASVRRK
jgi:hypothetical protein